ncbi:hypothetical protein [Bacillus sp. 1P06AnD]|uniref:hypothetical protein n=1 Tax=Bacillus sp. 1P06AnD TaxID=3132208 RepID=UPI00399FAD93
MGTIVLASFTLFLAVICMQYGLWHFRTYKRITTPIIAIVAAFTLMAVAIYKILP